MTDTRALLLELAGFLTLIAQGMIPPNVSEQALALLDKVGEAVVEIDGSDR